MTQEERQELLVALCGYLPYGVMVQKSANPKDRFSKPCNYKIIGYDGRAFITSTTYIENTYAKGIVTHHIKLYITDFSPNEQRQIVFPYLRPMSSMTEEEKKEYKSFISEFEYDDYWFPGKYANYTSAEYSYELVDWLNEHHFDYRGLIEKGLALEAPTDMYNN